MTERATYKVGANGILIRDGKVLLGLRKNSADGWWGLPGGHLEFGEKMEDAVLRELTEETGMTATKATFINLVNDIRFGDGHRIQVAFLIEDAQGEPRVMEPESCYEWQWFPLDGLPEAQIFPPFLKHLKAFKEKQMFVDDSNLVDTTTA